jgi:hypothetical protein
MLFRREVLAGIAAGRITLAFRRWSRPTVKAGGTLRTPAGVLAIRSVDAIGPDDVTDADARRAGFASRAALERDLDGQRAGALYRIAFRFAGADPRIALRATDKLSAREHFAIAERLDRLDAGRGGPWTRKTLALIGKNPGMRAADLATTLGEGDLKRFKTRIRRLKALGLTESLDVGYRLAPRGRAFLGRRAAGRS